MRVQKPVYPHVQRPFLMTDMDRFLNLDRTIAKKSQQHVLEAIQQKSREGDQLMDGASIGQLAKEYLMEGSQEMFRTNIDLRGPYLQTRHLDIRI